MDAHLGYVLPESMLGELRQHGTPDSQLDESDLCLLSFHPTCDHEPGDPEACCRLHLMHLGLFIQKTQKKVCVVREKATTLQSPPPLQDLPKLLNSFSQGF